MRKQKNKRAGFFWLFIWRVIATVICLLFSVIIGGLVVELTVGFESEYASGAVFVLSSLLFLFNFASIQVFSALFKNIATISHNKGSIKVKDVNSTKKSRSKKKND